MHMDDMMDMDMDMDMSMVMTFGDFSDYKLKLLFDAWDIEEKWQFALSWCVVVLATILYHYFKYIEGTIQLQMFRAQKEESVGRESDPQVSSLLIIGSTTISKSGKPAASKTQSSYFLKLRIAHAIIGGLLYGLALMLMLVAMTYNPSLFLALVVGFVIGDYLFFHRRDFASLDDGDLECH